MTFPTDDIIFPSHLRTPQRELQYMHPQNPIDSEMLNGSASVMELNEDETCLVLTMGMPGVRAKDLQISVQRGVLFIRGNRRIMSTDGRVVKRQKLSRRFSIDTDVVNVSRAVANIFNGALVLYAPKKSKPVTVRVPVTEDAEFVINAEFHTPGTTPYTE